MTPWQFQSWLETPHEHGWFAKYLAMPPPRNVLNLMPLGISQFELAQLLTTKWWVERAVQYDRWRLERELELASRRLNAPSETPARVAAVTRLQGVLAERELEKHLSVSEGTPAPVTSVREASRMAVAAVTLGRLELGAPVALDEQHAPDMSNWTDDEVVEWQAKLAEKAKGK